MLNYVEWIDTKGFWLRNTWDMDKQIMGGEGKMILFPHVKRILSHALTFNEKGKLPYETILYSATKKSAKTTLAASVGAWYAEEAQPGTEIYVIANSKEQGEGRVFQDLIFHYKHKQELYGLMYCNILQYRIEFPNGTFIQVLSKSFKSSAGSRHALTLWDELWGSCLTPETLVLKDDLTWVPVGDLKVDDKLIAFDEERPDGKTYRNWKRGRVVATGRNILPVKYILLDDNVTPIAATLNHKWLVRRGNHNEIQWIETGNLKKGDKLMKVIETWETRTDYDAGYIAGALDGEGSLSYEKNGGARLCFSQRPNVMWDEMERLYEESGVSAYDTGKTVAKRYSHGFKTAKDMIITRKSQIMKILGSTRPKRLLSKFDIERMGRMTAIKWVEVLETWDDEKEIVTLTTDTQTYIAEGFCSHNTTELDRRMWDEMIPIPTVNNSLRFISTYAGFENESELLWELYLRGVGSDEHRNGKAKKVDELTDLPCWKNGRQFTYWTHEPTMPWQTQEYLDEQLESERPSAYLRLHENQWVSSQETFIPKEWWERAETAFQADALIWDGHPYRRWPIVVGVDAGIFHDSSAMVGVTYDAARGKVAVVFHKIWVPKADEPVDIDEMVASELLRLYNRFRIVSVVCDPTQLVAMIMRLEKLGLPIRKFDQTSGNMIPASQMLYDLLKNRNMEAYPAEDLKRHVQMAVAETSARGFRIVKTKSSKHHRIDGAIALAMASLEAVVTGGVDTTIPVILNSPFSDATAWRTTETTNDLPWELRD